MPLQATSGAASYDAFGGGVAAVPVYIEELFNTYLYTGNDTTQVITNGIDLATKGGMVWVKGRDGATNHTLVDTARGTSSGLIANTTDVAGSSGGFTSFDTTGFTFGGGAGARNNNGTLYVTWTFREQAKFFDVVTYSGTGSTRTVAHNLGSVPGCIIIKNLSDTDGWLVYHRSIGATKTLGLNSTGAADNEGATYFNDTEPTSTVFTVKEGGKANASSNNYVAYLFAHDAGGFGLTGTDNVISCGSFTTSGGGVATVDLGYEPQWLLIKSSSGTSGWDLIDNMRGMPNLGTYGDAIGLEANNSNAEGSRFPNCYPTATGFYYGRAASTTYIYIAIRRGPMKVPTSGTSVFGLSARTGTGANATVTGSAGVSDAVLIKNRGSTVASLFAARLTGTGYLVTSSDAAEVTAGTTILQANPWDVMDGVKIGSTSTITNASANTYINYLFRRAPPVFDIVCYTGNGSTQNVSHNLGVVPELMIVKSRSLAGSDWWVYASPLTTPQNKYLRLQSTDGESTATGLWGSSLPTSATFGLGAFSPNSSGETFIAYLFATCAGVSKVGSYTGTATTKQIDCGFTAGARFVLIKRTDSTGDWYVWDTARGIVSGNDPYFLLNTTAAEVTSTDYIDTYSAGFEISSTAPAAINSNGGSFIFLAIA